MPEHKKDDNFSEKAIPSAPSKLTRRDALKRIALVALGIAVLPQATFMNPSEALADEIYVPRYRSYARDFSRGYASYTSHSSYSNYSNYSSYSSYSNYSSYRNYNNYFNYPNIFN
jgi:hypothetical protein